MDAGQVLAAGDAGACLIKFEKIVLVTGATELFLPFPGWTLPNVMGVGGIQSMVKGGLEVRGKRVVIAGSGPLMLAVGASLKKRGAEVRVIAEQAPFAQVRGLASSLVWRPRKLVQGMGLKMSLADVEQRYGWWPVAAEESGRVEAVTLTDGHALERFECDYLATGFGLVPSTRVAALLGCRVERGAVIVNELQETSTPGVFAAGECTGVGGVDKALIEGRIAGLACAGREDDARQLGTARDRELGFAASLGRAFALRGELREMVKPDTIVCRCEDVGWGRIAAGSSWRDAKLQTRCGMGPCQGRVCGPAVSWLTGWPVEDARPPVFNVPLRVLAAMGAAASSREREA
jgi:NADPH-dependent 2,4-dienoyl-CoA reductase/sulfur reductase-like enzyme